VGADPRLVALDPRIGGIGQTVRRRSRGRVTGAASAGPGQVIGARRRESRMAARYSARSRRAAAALLVVAVLVAACGATSSPAPSSGGPGTGASPGAGGSSPGAGTASAAPTSSGEGGGPSGGDSSADPAAALRIGTPFAVTGLPAATAAGLQATFTKDLGAFGKAVRVGVRSITRDGASVAFLLAVAFPRGTLDDKTYGDAVSVLEQGAEQSFPKRLISNVEVRTGTMGGGQVGLFRKGDTLVIVLAGTDAIVVPVVTALIAANG
jgi:hypothetical protein